MNLYQRIGDLTCKKHLGKGEFGEVCLYKQDNTNNLFAVKIINKLKAKLSDNYKYLKAELEALRRLKHPNIAKLIKVIDNESQIHLLIIMEYCNGGSLSECLNKYIDKYKRPFTEEIVQYLTRQIVEALINIHENNIIHRDLKLENIMVHFENYNDKENLDMMKAKIKIIDFGLSKILSSPNEFATSHVGTPLYEDPRIIQNNFNNNENFQYSTEVDIWSLGCVCFEMIKGTKIFEVKTQVSLINKIKEGKYNLPQTVSREFISFLYGMLQFDGKLRLTARQLLDKSFLRKNIKDFHYLSVNHDLKEDKEFIELKSSIKIYKEKMNESVRKSYKRQISHEVKKPIQTIDMPNQNNKNAINNLPRPYQSFNINNGYSYYGQRMTPEDDATNSSSNVNNFSYPHSMNLPNYHSPLLNSNIPNIPSPNITQQQNIYRSMVNNNTNFNINSNINNSQTSNNSSLNPPFQRYNSQQLDKIKYDDNCIVF